jgi:hypothetical protein
VAFFGLASRKSLGLWTNWPRLFISANVGASLCAKKVDTATKMERVFTGRVIPAAACMSPRSPQVAREGLAVKHPGPFWLGETETQPAKVA